MLRILRTILLPPHEGRFMDELNIVSKMAVLRARGTYDGVGNASIALGHHPFCGRICDARVVLVGNIPQDMQQPPPESLSTKSLHCVPVELQAGCVQV